MTLTPRIEQVIIGVGVCAIASRGRHTEAGVAGERILIGDEICITVVRLTNGGVRLGIEAPSEVPVHREEIYQRILKERSDGAEQSAEEI